jgi:AcrR family transcriptional regulator
LLEAAGAVFDERGYDRATVREVGERARVDPALIVRYFGSKEGLYLTVMDDEDHAMPMSPDPEPAAVLGLLLERWEGRSMSPIKRGLISSDLSEPVHDKVAEVLGRRVLRPLTDELALRGVAAPALRAEALVACVLGLSLARRGGMLETLASASPDELADLVDALVESLARPGA